MNSNTLFHGLSSDFDECRKIIDMGEVVWLLDKDGGHVSRARSIMDGDERVYELVRKAGKPIPIAHVTDGTTEIPVETNHMSKHRTADLDMLMKEIQADHPGWTTDRTIFEVLVAYSWDIDYDEGSS